MSHNEILIADAHVEQLQVLLSGLRPGVHVQLVSSQDDAMDMLAQALADPELDTLHVLGHGAPGEVILGGQKIDTAAMPELKSRLHKQADSTNPDTQICLWSCRTGADLTGDIFMNAFAQTTNATVFASENLVGHTHKGGTWTLEKSAAPRMGVPFNVEALEAFEGVLGTPTLQNYTDSGVSSTDKISTDVNFVLSGGSGSNGNNQNLYERVSTDGGTNFGAWAVKSTAQNQFTVSNASNGVHQYVWQNDLPSGTATGALTLVVDTVAMTATAVDGIIGVTNATDMFMVTLSEAPSRDLTSADFVSTNSSISTFLKIDSTHYSVSLTPTANTASGNMTLGIKAGITDIAGNPTVAATIATHAIDTVAPGTPSNLDLAAADDTGSSSTDNITNQTTGLTITGNAEANATVELFNGSVSLGKITANSSGVFTTDISLSGSSTGYNITAKATDAAGNASGASLPLTITVDTVAPLLTPAAAVAIDNVINLAERNTGVTLSGMVEVGSSLTVNGVAATVLPQGSATAKVWNYTLTPAQIDAMGQGADTVTIVATDASGNKTTIVKNISVDTLAPTVGITGESSNNATTSLAKAGDVITTTFTSTDSVTGVTIGGKAATVTDLGNGAYSATYSVAAGDSATSATVVVSSVDAAGNTSSASLAGAVTIDAVVPNAPTNLDLAAADDTGSSSTDNITNQTTGLTISGTSEANATVELFNGGVSLGKITANSSGVFTTDISLSGSSTGYNITAKATDAAGNASGASLPLTITVDTVTPNAATISTVGGADVFANAVQVTLSGASSDVNATVVKVSDGVTGHAAVNATYNATTGAWSADITGLNRGALTVTADVADAAGNHALAAKTVYSSIGSAVAAASAGSTVTIAQGTYQDSSFAASSVTGTTTVREIMISKGISIVGLGDGNSANGQEVIINSAAASRAFVVSGDVTSGAVSISGIKVVGGKEAVSVDGADHVTGLGSLTVTNSTFVGQSTTGLMVELEKQGSDLKSLVVQGVVFDQSASAGKSININNNGTNYYEGIRTFGFDGNAVIKDVTVMGASGGVTTNASQYGIHLHGASSNNMGATGIYGSGPTMGDVTLDNVVVTGGFAKNAVAIYEYANIDGLHGAQGALNISGAKAGWVTVLNVDGIEANYDASKWGVVLGNNMASLQGEDYSGATLLQPGNVGSQIVGTAGTDIFNGKAGNDVLDGGSGVDIAQVGATSASDVSFGRAAGTNALTVSTSYTATDTLSNIEYVTATNPLTGATIKTFVIVDAFADTATAIAAAPAGSQLVKAGLLDLNLTDVSAAQAKGLTFYGADNVTVHASAADLLAKGPALVSLQGMGVDSFITTDVVSKAQYDTLVSNAGSANSIVTPSVTITDNQPAVANVAGGDVTYKFTFDQAVTNFSASDVDVANGTKGALVASTVPGEEGRVFTLTVTPQTGFEGSMSLTVGNASSSQVVDTSAPAAPVVTDDSALTNGYATSTTQTISVAAEAGSAVVVTNAAGATVASGVADATGHFTANVTGLGQGVNSLTATATDAVGNSSNVSTSLSINVDSVAPGTPAVTDTTALTNGFATSTTQTISVAAEAGSAVVVTNAAGATVASGVADATGHFTASVTGLGQGVNTLTATATDAAGNASSAGTVSINVDTVAPAAPAINTVAGNDVINIVERDATGGVVISGTTEAGATVMVNGQAATVSGTTWTTSLTASQVNAFGQGGETLTVVATDAAGNTSTQTKSISVDTVAPSLTPTAAVAIDNVINMGERDAGVRLSGMVEVGSSLTVNGVAATVQPQGSATAKVWSYTLTPDQINAMGQGADTVTIVATDASGNTTTIVKNISVDTLAPTIGVNGESSNNATTTLAKAGDVITTTFTSTDSVTGVTIGGHAATVTNSGNGTYSATYTVAAGDNATSTAVVVNSMDAAGNTSTASLPGAVTIDTVAPVAPALADTSDLTNGYATSTTQTISVDAEAGSAVVVTNAAGATVASGVADATGHFTANVTGLSLGDNSLTATATDKAGNTSDVSASLNIHVNNDPVVTGALSQTAAEGADAFTTSLLANATDADGNNLTVTNVSYTVDGVAVTGTPAGVSISGNSISVNPQDPSFDPLPQGAQRSITVNYSVDDGHGGVVASSETISITGTNDAPVIHTETAYFVENNVYTGHLFDGKEVTDLDIGDSHTFAHISEPVPGFTLNPDGSWVVDTNSFDRLGEGEKLQIPLTISVDDGQGVVVTKDIMVTIEGTNDPATIISSTTEVSEGNDAAAISTSGQLVITDADGGQAAVAAQDVAGTYGNFHVNTDGSWTYTGNGAYDELSVGQKVSDSITVTSVDGTATGTIAVNITGTNDAPVLSVIPEGPDNTYVYENQITIGHLTEYTTDLDNGDNHSYALVGEPIPGLTINPDGSVSIDMNSYDRLAEGEKLEIPVTYSVDDGHGGYATNRVTATVVGTNDAPLATFSAAQAMLEDTSISGQLTSADLDNGDTASFALVSEPVQGLAINADGSWTFDASSYDSLAKDETKSITVQYSVTDSQGSSNTNSFVITVTGTNDGATVSTDSVALTETNAALTTGGQLTITDVDSSATFVEQTASGQHGVFHVGSDGTWTYTASSANDELNVGQSVSDTFTVSSADGTQTSVSVSISGSNDGAVLSNATVVLSETNEALSTGGTLSISDVDSSASFIEQTANGQNGVFHIGTDGTWTYTANSANDNLNAGGSVSDSFVVSAADGTQTSVSVYINGTNDPAVMSTSVASLTESNTALTTSGVLTISDVDSSATFQTGTVAGTYGSLAIAENGAWTYTANSAHNEFASGQTYSETFTVKASDGTPTTVSVNIAGTNDAAVLSSATVNLTESNAVLYSSGNLTVSDVDSAATFQAGTQTGTYGNLTVNANGAWTYNSRTAHNEFSVNQTYSETFSVKSADGTATSVVVNIKGTNDIPVISAVTSTTATVTEDGGLHAEGQLSATDIDSQALTWTTTSYSGKYGSVSVDASGKWSYDLNNAKVQALGNNSVQEQFNVRASDSHGYAYRQITINILGQNDPPVISSSVNSTQGFVTEDGTLATTGQLMATDAEGQALTWTTSDYNGSFGSVSVSSAGKWTYNLDNAKAQQLAGGASVTETFNVKVTDSQGGVAVQQITVSIAGTNDGASVTSAVQALSEADAASALNTSGKVVVTDVDNGQSLVVAKDVAGTYGTFHVNADGTWTYTGNGAHDELTAGQKVSDSITVTSADGTATGNITVNITGSNDLATVSSSATALSESNASSSLNASGQLVIADADTGEALVVAKDVAGTYGNFHVNADGSWTYTGNGAHDELTAGQKVSDSITVTSVDGTATGNITVNITGSNDLATVSSAATAVTESNDASSLNASGQLVIADADAGEALVVAKDVAGTYGTFHVNADGSWTYTGNGAHDELNAGQQVSDSISVTTVDGTATGNITVNITGSNDAATVSTATTAVSEANDASALNASGQLVIADADAGEALVVAKDVAGAYGTFHVNADGSWTYTGNGAHDELTAGQMVSDSITVTSIDGTATGNITVNITGSNDLATVSSAATAVTESNDASSLNASGQLVIADADEGEALVVAKDVAGTYGNFHVNADGSWTYTGNGAHDELTAGQQVSDSITVTSADGTATGSITVNITGSNDLATVSSATTAVTEGNAASALNASGKLTIADADAGEALVVAKDVAGTYGTFHVNADGSWTYTGNGAHNELNAGQQVSDSITVTSVDGTATGVITVNITGSNDIATVSSATTAVTEGNTAAALSASGKLVIADADAGEALLVAKDVAGTYGTFHVNADGSWTYTGNGAHDELTAGQQVSDSITVTSMDGTATGSITVNITGSNDLATVSSAATAVTEANTAAALNTSGKLTIADVDTGEALVVAQDVKGTYGTFHVNADGSWTYTGNGAHDELTAGQQVSDSITVTSVDGTGSGSITVNITGSNDAATVSSATTAVTEGNDASALNASGKLTITDADTGEALVVAKDVAGTYGTFHVNADGSWTYTGNGAHDELAVGQKVSDSITVSSVDGTATGNITVNITGTNDAAIMSSAVVPLTETDAVLTTSGSLSIADVDSAATFQAANLIGGYGNLSINAAGVWTYTANSAHNEFVGGQTYTEVFTVRSADNTASTVTVNITGTNDSPRISATTAQTEARVVEDGTLRAQGQLTATDAENQALTWTTQKYDGKYGSVSVDATGKWTYDLNNAKAQAIETGAEEQFEVKATDSQGGSDYRQITIRITGNNDSAVISGTTSAALTEANTALSTGGQLTATDVDSSAAFVVQTGVAGGNGFGTFSIDASGKWAYTMNTAHDEFKAGTTYTDNLTVKTADGTAQIITVSIAGTNDAAVIGGVSTAVLTETNAAQSASGQLTVTDVDSAATFIAQTGVAGSSGFGNFSVNTAGKWSYTMNTAHNEFVDGQAYTDSFTVQSADGTAKVVTVTINGTDDKSVIAGVSTAGLTETNAVQTATGQLTVTDVDGPAPGFVPQTGVKGNNSYGVFSVDASGKWGYTMNTAHDEFAAGKTYTDSVTVTTTDGVSQVVTVTIAGTNDAASIGGVKAATLTETNAIQTASGQLTVTDVDSPATFVPQTVNGLGGFGKFSIDATGKWTYTMSTAHDEFSAGKTYIDRFFATTADGTPQEVIVTILGTDDKSTIAGVSIATLTESNAAQTVTGQLLIADVDSVTTMVVQNGVNGTSGYGKFSVDATGKWTYVMNTAHDEFRAGTTYTDSFTSTTSDGISKVVTVSIVGTNDAAVIGGVSTATLTETNAVLTATGVLSAVDQDSAAGFTAQTGVAGTSGYGKFSIDAVGKWTYTMNTAHDEFKAGVAYTDSFSAKSADGTIKLVTVTINGTDDQAVIGGTSTATLSETNAIQTATGTLAATDVDSTAVFVAQTAVAGTNGYGKFTVDTAGKWTYTMNTAHDEFAAGKAYTDSITVTTADGASKVVTVTMNGTDDATVIQGVSTAALTETNAIQAATGKLIAVDIDSTTTFVAQTAVKGLYGTFNLGTDGTWNYSMGTAHDEFSSGKTYTDTFTAKTATGTSQVVTVTINGSNDSAVITGTSTAALTETNVVQTATGTLAATDIDSAATFNVQTAVNGANGYGKFTIDATGKWVYTMNTAHDEFKADVSYTDSFTATTADGTGKLVTVTIAGTDDKSVIGGVIAMPLTEADAVLTTQGTLLYVDVDGSNYSPFQSQINVLGTGGYGRFSIGTDGKWVYSSTTAHNEFKSGTVYTDSFTAKTADGLTQVVTVTITGTNDAAVIGGVKTINLTETDAIQTATGQLTITDVDSVAAFVPVTAVAGTAGYGKFTVDATGKWSYVMNTAQDQFVVGKIYTDTLTVTTADGTTQLLTVNIAGTNDAAKIIGANLFELVETNVALTAAGTLTSTDVDGVANAFTVETLTGTYGSLKMTATGAWTYTASSAQDQLSAGARASDVFVAHAADGTEFKITVNITGTNDAAVISGTRVIELLETDSVLTTSGSLTSTDVDGVANAFTAQTVKGVYGSLVMSANGGWNYTAASAQNQLAAGVKATDIFTVSAADGTATTITVNITGTNDAAVISGTKVFELVETDAVLTATGTLTSTDVDGVANAFKVEALTGTYGTLKMTATGAWTYAAASAQDQLVAGARATDVFLVHAADGTESSITVNITGTNDAAVISGTKVIELIETNAALTAAGILTSTDKDGVANAFTVETLTGTYGSLTMNANGAWSYSASSAQDQLSAGAKASDIFTIHAADGTIGTITVNITGTNDAAIISGTRVVELIETDAILIASGSLTSTDLDGVANAFTAQTVKGVYGSLVMTANGSWTYASTTAQNQLPANARATDVFFVSAADGTQTTITVNITGTNDAAVISGTKVIELLETNAPLTATGVLTSTDVDGVANAFTVETLTGTYGGLKMTATGAWTYTASSAWDQLPAGAKASDVFTIHAADGTASTITVNITGTNDAAVISGTKVFELTETNAVLTTSGVLTSTDVDGVANAFTVETVKGTYGSLTMNASGAWTYTASSAQDQLAAGVKATDVFTIHAADGTIGTITVNITGTNDAAIISGTRVVELVETDAVLTTTGSLTSTDVDGVANAFTAQSVKGTYGNLVMSAGGTWVYTASSAQNQLPEGAKATDVFTVSAADGTTTTITVNITGTNDAAIISGTKVFELTESNAVLSTSGVLTSTDVDGVANAFTAETLTGSYGSLAMNASGAWTYTAASAQDQLPAGAKATDVFTIHAADGTASTITVNITGTNDAAIISGTKVFELVETDAALTTSGNLTSTDVDGVANAFTVETVKGTYGSLTMSATGDWTYTASSAQNQLAEGAKASDTFTVHAADGTASTITVNITGTNDLSVITGTSSVSITENNDAQVITANVIATDPDNTTGFVPQTNVAGDNNYGSFTLDASGKWVYTMNEAHNEFLPGETYTDSITVTTIDGVTQVVTVSISGADAASTFHGDILEQLTEGDIAASVSGQLTTVDADSDVPAAVVAQVSTGDNGYGTFTVDETGAWTYTMNGAHNEFVAGTSYTDTTTVKNADGTTQLVTVHIAGTNDASVITGSSTGSITETNAVQSVSGQLVSTDVDNSSLFTVQNGVTGSNGYGAFSIDASGKWTYTMNSAHDEFTAGQVYTDSTTVTSIDGTQQVITVNITGSNEAAVITPTVSHLVETDATITASGQIEVSDVDNAALMQAETLIGTYGNLTVAEDGSWTYVTNTANNQFVANQTYVDSFTVTSIDGTTGSFQVNILGTNDAAVISGSTKLSLTETNAVQSASAQAIATDADGGSGFVARTGLDGDRGYGTFSIDASGRWTYAMNTAHNEFVAGQVYTDNVTISTASGTSLTLKVEITGTNDAAVITANEVVKFEKNTAADLTASGTLELYDFDSSAQFVGGSFTGDYGTLNLASNGVWTYTASSAHNEFMTNALYTDTFTVASSDGTTSTVKVNMIGTADTGDLYSVENSVSIPTSFADNSLTTLTTAGVQQVIGGFDDVGLLVNAREDVVKLDFNLANADFKTSADGHHVEVTFNHDASTLKLLSNVEAVQFNDALVRIIGADGYKDVAEATNAANKSHVNASDAVFVSVASGYDALLTHPSVADLNNTYNTLTDSYNHHG